MLKKIMHTYYDMLGNFNEKLFNATRKHKNKLIALWMIGTNIFAFVMMSYLLYFARFNMVVTFLFLFPLIHILILLIENSLYWWKK